MAILQLSRITHRKGLADDLPPQLSAAELGWVLDERKLFIGNGELTDGAPVTGNTEILTEFSDILGAASTYTYSGSAAGYVVDTGGNTTDILRSLQSKFDDFASVKDFGAIGDGIVDDTDAINRALFQLFCIGTNPGMKRSLYFPAGIYRVTGSIKIPPHAKLWGEGLTSSIIKFIAADPILASAMIVGEQYAISDLGDTSAADWQTAGAGNTAPTFPSVNDIFIALATTGGTGTVRSIAFQVVETADSLQQTGANMTSNSAIAPTGIEMNAMGIHSDEDNTLLKLDSVTNSGFSYLGLAGPNTNPTSNIGTTAIEIASSVSASVTSDITLSKLITYGTTYGLRAAGRTKGIVLETSGLSQHYKGVYITNPVINATAMVAGNRYKIVTVSGTPFVVDHNAEYNREGITFTATATISVGTGTVISMDDPGPTGIVISRNIFDEIVFEGIHFENTLFNSSGYNVFYDVGTNLGGGTGNAISPVITMETDQCVSIGDLFEREDESDHSRILLAGNGGIAIDNTHSIHLGSYERQVGIAAELLLADTGSELFKITDTSLPNSYQVDYHITTSNATKRGTITVSSYNGTVTYADEFTETGTTGITLDAVDSGLNSNSEVQFTAANDATINFSVVIID